MATREERAKAKLRRAAQLQRLATLPEHLQLGVTLPGMRELLSQLPSDAVEQVNAKIPLDTKTNQPKYPKNVAENGYVNQYFVALWAQEDKLTVCERLRKQGSPHVGKATVFVSWFLDTPIDTLLDALANFVKQKGLREEDTFFWVCDYVIKQTDVDTDLEWLGKCVSAVWHTVLLMEPWHDPQPLRRAYCIKEVYHTQAAEGAQFDVVMASAQQDMFEAALVDDLDSIQASLSKVDVRNAECRKPEHTKAILSELEQMVGIGNCNTLIIDLLREALVAQAQVALARLPVMERGTSVLLSNVGQLLKDMGKLNAAKPLFEEAMRARRGGGTLDTLDSISNMGELLRDMGQLKEARPLLEEALKMRLEMLGNSHPDTLTSTYNMGWLLYAMGRLEEAMPLHKEALQARKKLLGDRHKDTLASISAMGLLLQAMGQLKEARPLLEEALQARRETLGDRHPDTLTSINNMGQLLQYGPPGGGHLEEARPLLEEALQARKETLGNRHPNTLTSINNMGELLLGLLLEARAEELRAEEAKGTRACARGSNHEHESESHSDAVESDSLELGGEAAASSRPMLDESDSSTSCLLEEARQLREEAIRARMEVNAQQIRADLRDELRNTKVTVHVCSCSLQ